MDNATVPDISQPRMVSLEEVARLFDKSTYSVKRLVSQDRFPVRPRTSGKGVDLQWSSVDLRRYFEDGSVAKRYTKQNKGPA